MVETLQRTMDAIFEGIVAQYRTAEKERTHIRIKSENIGNTTHGKDAV